jgi:hypothetical protein
MIINFLEFVKLRCKFIAHTIMLTNGLNHDKLLKKLRHCKQIIKHCAAQDGHIHTFTLDDDVKFGDPLRDFKSHWKAYKQS